MKGLAPWQTVATLTLASCLAAGPGPGAALAVQPPSATTQATQASAAVWAPLQAQAGGGLQRLVLSWSLLTAARDSRLDSMQVLDAQGQILPSAWAGPAPEELARRELKVPLWAWPDEPPARAGDSSRRLDIELDAQGRVRRLQTRANPHPGTGASAAGGLRWLLDLSALRQNAERPLDLLLDWPSPPGGQALTVQLEGSGDAQHWQPLRTAQLLDLPAADTTPALKLRRIDWPASQPLPAYLRLRFDAPVLLRTATLGVESHRQPELESEDQSWRPEPRASGEAPRWRLDLPLALRPEALQVQLPALNQLLSLRLEQRQQDDQAWRPVQHFVAWRMQRGSTEAQSPAEPVRALAARQWRLVAQGPVPAALAEGALRLQWQWRPPQLVSLLPADPALLANLRLQLGGADPGPGRLALQTLMPDYRPGSEYLLPQARVGAIQIEPVQAPDTVPTWKDPAARKRWGLWLVLGLSVLGLAGLAWRLKGELGSSHPPQA